MGCWFSGISYLGYMKIDFIGIGAHRSATTWIAEWLRRHPDVCFARRKEVAFFNEDAYRKGIGYYESFFNGEGLKGEFTPTYLYSKVVAKRINWFYPDVKLIVCLRNPVYRAYSHYNYDKALGLIPQVPFEEVVERYIPSGMYSKHLKVYYDLFPKENIFVMKYENIEKDPQKFMDEIYSFLGLNSIKVSGERINYANQVEHRSYFVEGVFKSLFAFASRYNLPFKSLKGILFKARKLNKRRGKRGCEPMKPETREYLEVVFKHEMEQIKT